MTVAHDFPSEPETLVARLAYVLAAEARKQALLLWVANETQPVLTRELWEKQIAYIREKYGL